MTVRVRQTMSAPDAEAWVLRKPTQSQIVMAAHRPMVVIIIALLLLIACAQAALRRY